jgi:hypothetical protein
LQQHLEGVADFRRRELGEAFGAVAALQQERPALGHLGKLPAQLAGFAGKHQRRIAGQGLLDLQQVRGVGVDGCCWIGRARQLSGLQGWLITGSVLSVQA